jgi:molecular chaperone DnaK (HSP70)
MSKGYEKEKGKPLPEQDQRKLILVAEKIKKALSFKQETSEFIDGPEGPFEFKMNREEFNQLISLKITQIKMLMEEALDNANLKPEHIDQTLLVGGSTRIPEVINVITDFMGKPPVKGVNVDEAVALGAAYSAGLNAASSDLSATQKKSLQDVKLTDVSNHYFGTGMLDWDANLKKHFVKNDILIPRDTKLPYSITKPYVTAYDGQTAINCEVTQSEHEETDMEFVNTIAKTELHLPPDRPAGQPIDVTFTYDKSSRMICEFEDITTGKKETLELRPESTLAPEEAELDFKIE